MEVLNGPSQSVGFESLSIRVQVIHSDTSVNANMGRREPYPPTYLLYVYRYTGWIR